MNQNVIMEFCGQSLFFVYEKKKMFLNPGVNVFLISGDKMLGQL